MKGTGWSLATAVWAVVAVVIIWAAFRECSKRGDNKAELAAAIERLAGRSDVYAVQIEKNTNSVETVLERSASNRQALIDLRELSTDNFRRYNHDIYAPRFDHYQHNGRAIDGCGRGDDSRFIERQSFTAGETTVTKVTTC